MLESFLIKLTLTQVFSYEYCEIFKNSFFKEHLWWLLLNNSVLIHLDVYLISGAHLVLVVIRNSVHVLSVGDLWWSISFGCVAYVNIVLMRKKLAVTMHVHYVIHHSKCFSLWSKTYLHLSFFPASKYMLKVSNKTWN